MNMKITMFTYSENDPSYQIPYSQKNGKVIKNQYSFKKPDILKT